MRRPPATPPTNVVLHYSDGRRIPVDTAYAGWIGGVHVWEVVNAEDLDMPDAVTIDRLPGLTTVRMNAGMD